MKVNGKFECIAFMKFEMKNISNSTVLIKTFFDLVKDKKYKCIKFTKLKRISKSTKETSFCKKKTKNFITKQNKHLFTYFLFNLNMKDLNCVSDVHPPRFTSCPSNIEVFTKEIVTWDKPKVGDNVGINNIDFLGSQHNNTFFLSGSFMLGYIARDFEGNVAVCQFTVSVWEEGTIV